MLVFGTLILGVLFTKRALRQEAGAGFSTKTNAVQRQSTVHVFDETPYYQQELKNLCEGKGNDD